MGISAFAYNIEFRSETIPGGKVNYLFGETYHRNGGGTGNNRKLMKANNLVRYRLEICIWIRISVQKQSKKSKLEQQVPQWTVEYFNRHLTNTCHFINRIIKNCVQNIFTWEQ